MRYVYSSSAVEVQASSGVVALLGICEVGRRCRYHMGKPNYPHPTSFQTGNGDEAGKPPMTGFPRVHTLSHVAM